MEEPDGLQSMGLQRVGHNRATSLSFSMYILYRVLYIYTIVCSAIVYSPTVNIRVDVSLQIRTFVFSKYMLRSGIAGSYDKSVLETAFNEPPYCRR